MKTFPISLFSAFVASLSLISTTQAQPKPSMARPIGLTGIVAGSFTGNEFILRANGATYRVRPLAKVAIRSIRGGDRVRVWGRPTGLRINYANVRVLQVGASSNPEDFDPAPNQTVESQPNTR
jgi:hypothetical protein